MENITDNSSVQKSSISRRNFLKTTAKTAAAFSIVPRFVLGGSNYIAPSEKINIALIGSGGQGIYDMKNLIQFPEVQYIAVADPMLEWDYSKFYFGGWGGRKPAKQIIEEHYAQQKDMSSYKGCNIYEDFREMLEVEEDIDAVTVETTDNVHAVAAMAALKKGKHVYCQKPLTHDVFEARSLMKMAQEEEVATQMGNQGHAMEGIKLTWEWYHAGAIGEVREVHCWTDRPGRHWSQAVEIPTEIPSVPRVLNWNLWLGPARFRPYHPMYCPFNWRGFYDFGTGALGDMGCHIIDIPMWVLDLGTPVSIEAVCNTPYKDEIYPVASMIQYEFPKRNSQPPVTMTWYDGGLMPFRFKELEEGRRMGDRDGGILLIGDKGILMAVVYGDSPRLIPETAMQKFPVPPKSLKRTEGIYKEWVDACRGGEEASSNFNVSGLLSEIVLLGNVALRFPNQRLYYDGENMEVTNIKEANQYLKRDYFGGWSL